MSREDVLSEVFSTLRLQSDVYFWTRFSGAYSIEVPREQRHIRFHLVLRGECWLTLEEGEPALLSEGDIALVPNGAAQVLSASPDLPPIRLNNLVADGALRDQVLNVGQGPENAALLCGFCWFDRDVDHPVLASLPSLIHLRFSDLGAEPWLTATMKLIALEANLNGQGSAAALVRMIEIIVIQATRRLTHTHSTLAEQGFLAALSDHTLSKALLSIHTQPAKKWKVGELAKEAGMSRAAFAKRFHTVVGKPPMEYLTDWRLLLARSLLRDSALGIEEIAVRCGYRSLPSFSRRYKQRFGSGPGAFRRGKG